MLEEKIMNDYKDAMKNRDSVKSTLLSFLRAEMINVAVAKKKKLLDDSDAIVVVRKQIKQHQDSIEQFKKGNRTDLAEKEEKELQILKTYLPLELSQDEVKSVIEEIIVSTGANSIKDMGRVMKEVTARVSGKADGKLVSDLVRERLSKSTP